MKHFFSLLQPPKIIIKDRFVENVKEPCMTGFNTLKYFRWHQYPGDLDLKSTHSGFKCQDTVPMAYENAGTLNLQLD